MRGPRGRKMKRISQVAVLGVFALLPTIAVSGGLGLAAQGSSPPLPSEAMPESAWVTYGRVEVPNSVFDYDETTREMSTEAAILVEDRPEDFLGSYIAEDGDVTIVAATEQGERLAKREIAGSTRLDVTESTISLEQAGELGETLPEMTAGLWESVEAWGAAPEHRGMFVTLTEVPSEGDKVAIERFASTHQVPVYVEVEPGGPVVVDDSRWNDPSPYAGGMRWADGDARTNPSLGGYCSSAAGYLLGGKGHILTAGHCMSRNSGNRDWMWIFSGRNEGTWTPRELAGRKAFSTYRNGHGTVNDGGLHGDLALVNVADYDRIAGTTVWWGTVNTTNKIPIVSRIYPERGVPVAINGATSGSDRGLTVARTNVRYRYPNGDVIREIDRAVSPRGSEDPDLSDCSVPGDSGGGVALDGPGGETDISLMGVVSGHRVLDTGGCFQYFTGVEEAIEAWGGGLKYD